MKERYYDKIVSLYCIINLHFQVEIVNSKEFLSDGKYDDSCSAM